MTWLLAIVGRHSLENAFVAIHRIQERRELHGEATIGARDRDSLDERT